MQPISNSLHTLFVLAGILALAVVLTHAAPLTEFSGEVGFSLEDPDSQKFVSNSFDLTIKIQSEIQAVLQAHTLPLPSDSELGVMEVRLQVPSPKLRECLSRIYVESCLAQIHAGLRLYRGFLPVVQHHVEPAQRHHVDTLFHDAKDLQKQIHLQMLSLELHLVSYPEEEGDLSSPPFLGGVSGESERRIGSYILLRNFKSFMMSVYRALRSLQRH
ncbi:myelomonocytic growth factor-like [Polyodon spathula]|uniref:myelomonocytic growth factor-like n=1 Tax=Polyodon spathula TaxID=7913 RepID=UPI001B7EFF08|nr:myelomonocytic growth factor-like [Polyodon spathula]